MPALFVSDIEQMLFWTYLEWNFIVVNQKLTFGIEVLSPRGVPAYSQFLERNASWVSWCLKLATNSICFVSLRESLSLKLE